MRKRVAVIMAGIVTSIAVAGCERGEAPAVDNDAGDTAQAAPSPSLDPALASRLPEGVEFAAAEEGRRLFDVCATCHGFGGEGTALGPSLRDDEWIHGTGRVEEIAAVIRDGVPEPEEFPVPMPPLGGGDFDRTQVNALAAYVALLATGEVPPE